MTTIRLPLKETAQVSSIKLPLKETAWVIDGFIISENIISWKTHNITLLENIKSRIILDAELIDINHVKITWYGDYIPIVQIFKKKHTDDLWDTTPIAEVKWNVGGYIIPVDIDSYDIKVIGAYDTGDCDPIQLGYGQQYPVNIDFSVPVNNKNYYFELNLVSEYRFEVNF